MPGFGSPAGAWHFWRASMFIPGWHRFDFWPAIPLSMALLLRLLHRSQRTQYGFADRLAVWCRLFFHRRVLGVCQHPRLWQHPGWLAAAITGIFCLGLALLFAAHADQSLPAPCGTHMTSPDWSICGALGAVRVAEKLAAHRISLGYMPAMAPWTPLAGWIPVVGVFGTSWLPGCHRVLSGGGGLMDRQQRRYGGAYGGMLVASSRYLGFLWAR